MPPKKTSKKATSTTTPIETSTPTETPTPVVVENTPPENVENTVIQPTETTTPSKKTAEPKKRSKKQVQVVAIVTPQGIEGTFQSAEPRRSLIAHLQVHSNEVQFFDQALQYDPNPPIQPEPYDEGCNQELFESVEKEKKEEEIIDSGKPVPIPDPLGNPIVSNKQSEINGEVTKGLQPFYRCDLMVQYKDSSKTQTLPSTSEIACLWDTEFFSGPPCVIPEREDNFIYRVYGNFCCPECALAYLLNEIIDPHVRWERMALLHRFYQNYYENRIFPAPSREILKKFGGPLSIEEYRATIHEHLVRVDIQVPPLVSILGTMDTKPIDFYDTNLRSNGTNTNLTTERISKAEEGLRLRRTKPLKDRESTLDACMKISIVTKNTASLE
jgi:hypothetical protein